MRDLQGERLRAVVAHAYENVPPYRERLDEAGVDPSGLDGIGDIERLPFTTKEDLRDTYPDGMFAVNRSELVCPHASSGTTGKPKVVGYPRADMDLWREVMARCLVVAGVRPDETVQNAYGYGLFTGGLGVHHGCDELGAAVVPIGGRNTARQLEFLEDLGSETLTCTPSYALYLAEEAERRGIDLSALPLSTVIFGAEPCTDPMREAIEARLEVAGVDIYGLSEVIGPGVSIECAEAQDGLHVQEDVFYPEVVDPETGEGLLDGEEGELVLTTLTKEGIPVVRYRTGDPTSLTRGECACGRTTVRLDNVTGRVDDMVTLTGVNRYPGQVEAAVLGLDGVAPHYRIDLYREASLDRIEVTVEREAGSDIRAVGGRVERALADTLDFTPDELRVVDPDGVERQETGRVQRVFDHR
jgi:phenylacetate-CoA ligase